MARNVCFSDVYGGPNLAYKWQIRGETLSRMNVRLVQQSNVWKLRTACIQVFSQRIEWLGLESEGDHSPPYYAKVKNGWSYYLPPHAFIACRGTTSPLPLPLVLKYTWNIFPYCMFIKCTWPFAWGEKQCSELLGLIGTATVSSLKCHKMLAFVWRGKAWDCAEHEKASMVQQFSKYWQPQPCATKCCTYIIKQSVLHKPKQPNDLLHHSAHYSTWCTQLLKLLCPKHFWMFTATHSMCSRTAHTHTHIYWFTHNTCINSTNEGQWQALMTME